MHFGLVLNGNRMNQKATPHKWSLVVGVVVGDQNDVQVLGICCFVYEEFDYNNLTLLALYDGKIGVRVPSCLLLINLIIKRIEDILWLEIFPLVCPKDVLNWWQMVELFFNF